MNSTKEIIEQLQLRKSSLCCEDVKQLLTRLGFDVRDGKLGGHKIYVHQGLHSFHSGSFNCGMVKILKLNPLAYITKIVQVLKQYKNELDAYLEKKDA